MKKCSKCKEIKTFVEFYPDYSTSSGYTNWCKFCQSINNGKRNKMYSLTPYELKIKPKFKVCWFCKLDYSIDSFSKDRCSKDGHASRCNLCLRDKNYKFKYGITLIQWQEMFEKQCGVCYICGQPETAKDRFGKVKELSVDHFVFNGKIIVRGLACHKHNMGIGLFDHDPKLLRKAADILEGFDKQYPIGESHYELV